MAKTKNDNPRKRKQSVAKKSKAKHQKTKKGKNGGAMKNPRQIKNPILASYQRAKNQKQLRGKKKAKRPLSEETKNSKRQRKQAKAPVQALTSPTQLVGTTLFLILAFSIYLAYLCSLENSEGRVNHAVNYYLFKKQKDVKAVQEKIRMRPILIYSTAIFRMGRSEGEMFSDVLDKQTTNEEGLKNLEKLGEFLKTRFASLSLKPETTSWISTDMPRSVNSASRVGATMLKMSMSEVQKSMAKDAGGRLINPRCGRMQGKIEDILQSRGCNTNSLLGNCLLEVDLHISPENFQNAQTGVAQAALAGAPLPPEQMNVITQFAIKNGYFDNVAFMKVMYSPMVAEIFNGINKAWDNFSKNNTGMKVFEAIASDDATLLGVLWTFGIYPKDFAPDQYPHYSSMLLFELWKIDDSPVVKVYWKKEEDTKADQVLEQVTERVRGCPKGSESCPIEIFKKSCQGFIDEQPQASCRSF